MEAAFDKGDMALAQHYLTLSFEQFLHSYSSCVAINYATKSDLLGKLQLVLCLILHAVFIKRFVSYLSTMNF
jgi:hypothetical protein